MIDCRALRRRAIDSGRKSFDIAPCGTLRDTFECAVHRADQAGHVDWRAAARKTRQSAGRSFPEARILGGRGMSEAAA
jgi:hypothetical protein